ncbi:ABC transporter permease [Xylanimonas allomyrinae]|uniref:ABC transporter permease n=1 Tax=Xylanimonas allomyrinae TaxID=2509459 RepID=A0A4P6ENS5_9MICO|nr:ABC transporter permease [Xylanimonas allomyrinae]QAY64155.1 ABC transporter permease [Xylanimonas allomyrinae]
MTSIASSAAPRAARPGLLGHGFATLLTTEAKVWLRDSSIFWVAFPTLILLLNLLMAPELREVAQGYGWEDVQGHPGYGSAVVLALLPGFIAMGMGMTTLAILPATFGGFREKGVLKLFSASPMRPQALFAAHAVINVAASLLGTVVMVAVAAAMTPVAMPQNLALTFAGILLGLAALLAIGSLVAAVVPKTNVGTIVGNTLFFVFLFVSGAVGGPASPGELLHEISRATPMGAAAQIIQHGWIGGETFPWIQMAVLTAWTLGCAPLAVKLFRWR